MLLSIIKQKMNIDLDYSLFSLLYLDKILEQMFGENIKRIKEPEFENFRKEVTMQLACFFGECIRQTYSGEWKSDPNMGLTLTKIGNQDVTAFPVSTAADRLSGEQGKIYAVTVAISNEVFKQIGNKIYHTS